MNEMTINVVNNSLTPKSSPLLTQSPSSVRTDLYKNSDKTLEQLRRRRNETIIELRKQKKESYIDRRRNISCYDFWSDNEDVNEEEEEIIDLNPIEIIEMLKTSNIVDIAAKYIRHLRKQYSKGLEVTNASNKPLMELMELIMSDQIITKLINCLMIEDCPMSLLQEVTSLITYLCGHKDKALVLVKSGIVPKLLSLLSYDSFGVIEQSVLALTYIWNSSLEMSQMLIKSHFVKLLVDLIDSETSVSPSKYVQNDSRIGLVRGLSWALYMICQNHDQISFNLLVQFIPYFVKLLKFSDTEVQTNVLKTLSATTERVFTIQEDESSPSLQMVQSVISNDSMLTSIIDYLSTNEDQLVLNAIRVIGNIVSWGESYAQIVIQVKALQKFGYLLTHHNSKVQKEAAFTLSNITAGNFAQIQVVIDANLIPAIVELLYMGDYLTQVEASHVLFNISAVGSFDQVKYILNLDNTFINMDVIDATATLITSQDPSVINTCLRFYNNVLVFSKKAKVLEAVAKRCETSSFLYHLDSLQTYNNTQIAVLATHIMDEFFSNDSSFEEDISLNTSLTTDERQMETNFSF